MGIKLLLAGRYQGGEHFFSPPEEPEPWLRRVEQWFQEVTGELLEHSRLVEGPEGAPLLLMRLHPAAGEVAVLAAGQARLVVLADTAAVGPGYHRYLCDLLKRMGEALHITWAEPNAAENVGDPTGWREIIAAPCASFPWRTTRTTSPPRAPSGASWSWSTMAPG